MNGEFLMSERSFFVNLFIFQNASEAKRVKFYSQNESFSVLENPNGFWMLGKLCFFCFLLIRINLLFCSFFQNQPLCKILAENTCSYKTGFHFHIWAVFTNVFNHLKLKYIADFPKWANLTSLCRHYH